MGEMDLTNHMDSIQEQREKKTNNGGNKKT